MVSRKFESRRLAGSNQGRCLGYLELRIGDAFAVDVHANNSHRKVIGFDLVLAETDARSAAG